MILHSNRSFTSDIFCHPLFCSTRFTITFIPNTSVTVTTIATARQFKTNWMNTHLKHCSRLNKIKKSFDTMQIGDSLIVSLTHYSKFWNKIFKPLNSLNCGIAGDRVQHVLWRAHDLCSFSSLRNFVILCSANNLYQDLPEHIANGLFKIASCFKQRNNFTIVFICGIFGNFFFYQGILSRTRTTHRTAGEGRGPSFTPFFHFHPLTNIQTFICNFACEMTITYF